MPTSSTETLLDAVLTALNAATTGLAAIVVPLGAEAPTGFRLGIHPVTPTTGLPVVDVSFYGGTQDGGLGGAGMRETGFLIRATLADSDAEALERNLLRYLDAMIAVLETAGNWIIRDLGVTTPEPHGNSLRRTIGIEARLPFQTHTRGAT